MHSASWRGRRRRRRAQARATGEESLASPADVSTVTPRDGLPEVLTVQAHDDSLETAEEFDGEGEQHPLDAPVLVEVAIDVRPAAEGGPRAVLAVQWSAGPRRDLVHDLFQFLRVELNPR